MALGSNQVDLSGWEDDDEDLTFTQNTSLPGQYARQWGLRMRSQGAALKVVANSKLRRLLAYSRSFNFTDIAIGDSALF